MNYLSINSYSITTIVLSLFLWYFSRKKWTPHRLRLPPGPKGLPFIGSALAINRHEPWLSYTEWKESYGELVSCTLLGQTYIIINSERVAKALLDQRSIIYSDRPVMCTSQLFGVDFNTGHLSSNSEVWKSHRNIFHQTLNSSNMRKYHGSVTEKARELLVHLLCSPEDFSNHLRTYAASVIMSVTYGYDVLPEDDPFLGPLDEVLKITTWTTPERAMLLNVFPQLLYLSSWFPGAELHRLAERCKALSPKVRNAPFQFVKECLSKNIENNSMVAQLLKDENVISEDRATYEQDIKDCATSNLISGIDTTRSTLTTLIMALILFPEVQDRAQAIIDQVVGRDRLPDLSDAPSLQYIDALLRETLRWACLVPMALPHMVTKDDVFEQRLIPKGSVIIPNSWSMTRDEERFPDATAFKPERHLDADGNLLEDDLTNLSFGYGRRVCPGRYLATTSGWLAAASMLSVFKFSKAIGSAGYEVDIFPKFTGGVARRPDPFPCRITPRFDGAEQLLNN